MSRELEIISHSEPETEALAQALTAGFSAGDLIVLSGSLGAGKTVFVRGLAKAMGIDPASVSSPSFTIVNEYPAQIPLYHFDLYRLKNIDELYEVGWDDYLIRPGLVVVEWGEKAEVKLPPVYYKINFERINDTDRKITVARVQS
jgi:tRNA threonylcarbamoyladenosine biosynthesis protein TsaE